MVKRLAISAETRDAEQFEQVAAKLAMFLLLTRSRVMEISRQITAIVEEARANPAGALARLLDPGALRNLESFAGGLSDADSYGACVYIDPPNTLPSPLDE